MTSDELDSLVYECSRRLHIVTSSVAYAIAAIEADPSPKFQLGTALRMGLSDGEVVDPTVIATMKHEYTSWIVGHGLADGTEAIAGLLNDLVGDAPTQLGCSENFRNFERLGLELKIKAARKVRLKPNFLTFVVSMNRARNCLIHRSGIVGSVDCDESGKLMLNWFGPVIHQQDGEGWVEVSPSHRGGFNRAEHGKVLIQFKDIERKFTDGERLILPPSDLGSLFWCLQHFVVALHVSANRLLGFGSIDQYNEADWLASDHP